MPVTALYAALLTPVLLWLSVRTIRLRQRHQIGIGDGGNDALRRAMRAHANFAEYVPFALLLIALAESQGIGPLVIHALGLALLAGRISHAHGISREPETIAHRRNGMIATFAVIAIAALINVAAVPLGL